MITTHDINMVEGTASELKWLLNNYAICIIEQFLAALLLQQCSDVAIALNSGLQVLRPRLYIFT